MFVIDCACLDINFLCGHTCISMYTVLNYVYMLFWVNFFPIRNCSWNMMMSCWDAQPKQRPKFVRLVKVLSDLLESDSNYLKLK